MKYHTANPALPHPDSEPDATPWPLDDAIAWAIKTLRAPYATHWDRMRAADELQYSHESQERTS